MNDSYLKELRELQQAGRQADLEAYVEELRALGYPSSILNSFANQERTRTLHSYRYPWHEHSRNLGQVSKNPLVSILVVSYNSGTDLKRLFPSLISQSYVHWELVLVENGCEDTHALAKNFLAEFKYVRADNPGFAEANNIGLAHADGELLLLLNPDTELHPETIKQLVHAISIDVSAAAACPLIFFAAPFYKLTFSSLSGRPFRINLAKTLALMEYRKIFTWEGQRDGEADFSADGHCRICLDIPLGAAMKEFQFDIISEIDASEPHLIQVEFEDSGEPAHLFSVHTQCQPCTVSLNNRIHSSSRYLINNAGSGLRGESGLPYDIGFGEIDIGQYAARAYREAFCGCCVLLRRDLFLKRKIFVREFFAYYEDSELSHWIRANNMNILFVPSSIVYHRHSESVGEGSPLWSLLVQRSQAVYSQFLDDSANLALRAPHIDYSSKGDSVPATIAQLLCRYDHAIKGQTAASIIANEDGFVVGIYNSYWNVFGGGEKHAIDFARLALNQGLTVYLLSETDFSIPELQEYFGVDLSGARKLVTGCVSESLTQRFDLFINSTFLSSLTSYARKSFYIVSFPSCHIEQSVMEAYLFLHNSHFSQDWAINYWGPHRAKVILPVLGFSVQSASMEASSQMANNTWNAKHYTILSVGRFTYSGHCKNQHILARVFASLSSQSLIDPRWRLVLVGSVKENEPASIRHFLDTREILNGFNAEVLANMERDSLLGLYRQSALYVHGTGLGVQAELNPEKCEHFGIAVFEALIHGCIPVVHRNGGPAFQVAGLRDAYLYGDEQELALCLREATRMWEALALSQQAAISSRLHAHATHLLDESVQTAELLLRP